MIAIDTFLPLTETIAPADEAAVAETIRQAAAVRTPVYPIGGGTRLDYGLRPETPGIGLSTARLARVVDHAAEDMTITVEAGLSIAQLTEHLAAAGQRLPIDVARADRATVGGVVATNPSGPRRFAAGTVRDYLIGVRAVDGRGEAFSAGGRVVKNAAGYDLGKLLIGSLGTLGVVTQVTLMVRPQPETSALMACDVPDFDAAERLLALLLHTQTRPAAIELLGGTARQCDWVPGPWLAASVGRLIVGYEGDDAEVAWMIGQLHAEWRELGIASPTTVAADEAEALWHRLADLPADIEICVPPSAVVGTVARLVELVPGGAIQSHAGNGVIRMDFAAADLRPGEIAARLREHIRPLAAAAGGSLVLRKHLDGAAMTRDEFWGPPPQGMAVMRAIKDRFDPQGILNRGRYIF